MIVRPDDAQFFASLAPIDPNWGGLGALPRPPDSRDYDLRRIPAVARMLQVGAPPSADLSSHVKWVANQGQLPSCVAHSTCNLESLYKSIEHNVALQFDGVKTYYDNGGNGTNGVATQTVLDYAQGKGLPELGSTQRERIGSYAFAPRTPGAFRDTVKAAIAAGHPCTLALLLPADFGWTSSGPMSQGYHQVVACGYDDTWVTVLNSWGDQWGNHGLGRVQWDFLEASNLQNGLCYAYSVTDDLNDGLGPAPTPTPTPTPKPDPQPNPNPQPNPSPSFTVAVSATPTQVTGVPSHTLPAGSVCGVAIYLPDGSHAQAGVVLGGNPQPNPSPDPTPNPNPNPLPRPTPNPNPLPNPTPNPQPNPSPNDQVQQELAAVNALRAQHGARPLTLEPHLMAAAQGYAEVLAAGGQFSHTGADGRDPFARMRDAGYSPMWTAGENIARGYPDVPTVMAAWTASPGHFNNMVNPMYKDIGIGIKGGCWVQDFGAHGPSEAGPGAEGEVGDPWTLAPGTVGETGGAWHGHEEESG